MSGMPTVVAASVVAAALLTGLPAVEPLAAQELAPGTWTGTVTPPDGDVLDVEFEIEVKDGELTGMLVPPSGVAPPMAMEGLSFEGDVLHFTWSPGLLLECSLEPEGDGSYAGPCFDPDGEPGFLTMVPPKDD